MNFGMIVKWTNIPENVMGTNEGSPLGAPASCIQLRLTLRAAVNDDLKVGL